MANGDLLEQLLRRQMAGTPFGTPDVMMESTAPGGPETPEQWARRMAQLQAQPLPQMAQQPQPGINPIAGVAGQESIPAGAVTGAISGIGSRASRAMKALNTALGSEPSPPPPMPVLAPAQPPAPWPAPSPAPAATAADSAPPAAPKEPSWRDTAGMIPTDLSKGPYGTPAEQREVDGTKAAIPPNVTMQAPVEQAGMLGGLGDFGSRLMSGLSKNSNLLLGLGAGLMGAPNLAQGLSRGFAYAAPGHAADIAQQLQTGSQGAMFNALVSAGVPRNLAAAGALNKEMGQELLKSYIAPKYDVKEIKSKNVWGQESTRLVAVNARDPSDAWDVQTGQPVGAGGARGGRTVVEAGARPGAPMAAPAGTTMTQTPDLFGAPPGGAAPAAAPIGQSGGPQSLFYAPGVTDENVDMNKSGEDFLNQFSPLVQDYVKSKAAGLMPSGRSAGFGAQMTGPLNMIATKYGQDIGHPIDDNTFRERTKYMTGLASSDSGVGKQVDGLRRGLNHFVDISDNLVKMKLSNGFGGPAGTEKTAEWINWYKSLSADQQELITKNEGLAAFLSREMGKVSGGTGVHEATSAANRLGGGFKSGKAAAGALEAAADIIDGSLQAMENKRDDLFPDPRYRPPATNFMGQKQQEQLDHIKRNIAILKGEAPRPKAGAATPAAKIAPGSVLHFDAQGNQVSGP